MESNVLTIKKEWVSQQTDKNNQPFVELKQGDVIELKDDGIYFTRKLDVGQETYNYKSVFENFRKNTL